jgi:purine nucleoside phosphorylase
MYKSARFYLSALSLLIVVTSDKSSVYANQHKQPNDHKNVLAVIGGSHIDRRHVGSFFSDDADIEETFTIETSVGTSPPILRMRYKDIPFYYIRFHGFADVAATGAGGSNFVSMFAAFHELGVTHIIAGATSGGMQPSYRNGDLILSNDIINLNFERPLNILAAAKISRPGIRSVFNPPVCPDIHSILYDISLENYTLGRVYPEAVVVQDDPSRYETPAEIRMYRTLGGDIITHNVVTEIIYARQLGMHLAVVNAISNPAVGVRPFTRDEEMGTADKIAEAVRPIIFQALEKLHNHEPECGVICEGERYSAQTVDESKK